MADFIDHYPRGIGEHEGDLPALMEWARACDIARPEYGYEEGKLFLGRAADGGLIGLLDDRHCMTVAGSRAGKGVSVIIPNLCLYPGSAVVIDPKGENAILTAARRGQGSAYCEGMGQAVHVLDPFGTVPNHQTASFNPLDIFDLESTDGKRRAVDDAALIADALVIAGDERDSHWDESARNVIEAVILHVMSAEPPERRTLPRVRVLLTRGIGESAETGFQTLIEAMLRNPAFGGVIAGAAGALDSMGENERGSVLSTARRNTKFLDSEPLQTVLGRSTPGLRLERLKTEAATLYLCLPAARMASHARWLRLVIGLALAVMERERTPPALPVLFLMDEFAQLGTMGAIASAAGLMAGFGVKLWPILQDLTQLKRLYRESWETFLGNAGCLQFFGNTDITTCEHVSKFLGKTRVIGVSESENEGGGGQERTGTSFRLETADLLQPAEVRFMFARGRGTQIVFIPEELPWALARVPYTDPIFNGKRDWIEGFRDPPPRAKRSGFWR